MTVKNCQRCSEPASGAGKYCVPCQLAIGPFVASRLSGNPKIHRAKVPSLELFIMSSFLSGEECDQLVQLIEQDLFPSGLLAPSADPEFRTSSSCNLRRDHPLAAMVEQKIDEVTGIDPRFGETIQGQRYRVGQRFKAHHDFFYRDQPYWPAQEEAGGQRTWTAMVVLAAPEAGGDTSFEAARVKVLPRKGNLMVWNNLAPGGEPNHFSLHSGEPVQSGTKVVITKWYRERPWAVPNVPGA